LYYSVLIAVAIVKYFLCVFIGSDEPIQEYKLTTVTYGTASAPFLATRCLKKLAEDNLVHHPKASQVLRRDFYVDDLLR
jgi:hypothetical protein